jgi:hypothetical protein
MSKTVHPDLVRMVSMEILLSISPNLQVLQKNILLTHKFHFAFDGDRYFLHSSGYNLNAIPIKDKRNPCQKGKIDY